jgi:hypothetical protein
MEQLFNGNSSKGKLEVCRQENGLLHLTHMTPHGEYTFYENVTPTNPNWQGFDLLDQSNLHEFICG